MKNYKTPEINVIDLTVVDVLTTSDGTGDIKIDVNEKWGDKLKKKD